MASSGIKNSFDSGNRRRFFLSFLRLAGNSDNPVVNLLSKPGLMLQGLTTKEPDEKMAEVAICAVEAVFDWKAYEEANFN